jgi:hypothetical protein
MEQTPIWVTLEVLTGGFASGRLLAGGPLQPHEKSALTRLGVSMPGAERQALNGYFLSDAGLAELVEILRSGYYQIDVPEESVLLIVAWLVTNGHAEAARNIIDVVSPQFGTLRFYPIPTQRPLPFGDHVYVESVGAGLEKLKRIQANIHILSQREAIQVWAPLYDEAVELFLETIDGDLPAIQPIGGRWTSSESRRFSIVGGWPCQRWVADWSTRAEILLSQFDHLSVTHQR